MKETILIVEDDRDLSDVVTTYLKNEGFSVSQAFTGSEALESAKTKPQLVLLDIMLPEIDGIELCRRIRENSHAPIIMISAKNTDIKFATYAARCINNEILMEFRKNKKHRGVLSIDFAINNEGEEYNAAEFTEELGYYDDDRLEREAELIDLRIAVSKLNERERQIIELRYYGEKSQKQVADLLGISQSYISRIERRILQKLKGKLNEIYQH